MERGAWTQTPEWNSLDFGGAEMRAADRSGGTAGLRELELGEADGLLKGDIFVSVMEHRSVACGTRCVMKREKWALENFLTRGCMLRQRYEAAKIQPHLRLKSPEAKRVEMTEARRLAV